jgi:peptidoglycan/LPS O-acetylase OafA/YrhL
MVAVDLIGSASPGAGFRLALAAHIGAGMTGVVSGLLAATARKRRGRHPRAGIVYLSALSVVVATAAVMAALRWPYDLHLLAIALGAGALALAGWLARRRRRRGWVRRHAIGLGGSYIALLTGFYVDNGPRLPVWDLLPQWMFWALPTAIGVPLIALGLRRFNRPAAARPHAIGRRGGRPTPPE